MHAHSSNECDFHDLRSHKMRGQVSRRADREPLPQPERIAGEPKPIFWFRLLHFTGAQYYNEGEIYCKEKILHFFYMVRSGRHPSEIKLMSKRS